VLLTAI